jgi:hypothetical protein
MRAAPLADSSAGERLSKSPGPPNVLLTRRDYPQKPDTDDPEQWNVFSYLSLEDRVPPITRCDRFAKQWIKH